MRSFFVKRWVHRVVATFSIVSALGISIASAGGISEHVKEIQRRDGADKDDESNRDDRPPESIDPGSDVASSLVEAVLDIWFDDTEDSSVGFGPLRGHVRAGVGSVFGDETTSYADAAIYGDKIGAALGYRGFFDARSGDGLDVINASVGYIIGGRESLEGRVWFGMSGLRVPGVTLTGGRVGMEVVQTLRPGLRLTLEGYGFAYEHDVLGYEFEASLSASFVQIGYRYYDLDTGPALHGPTAGLAVQF